MIIILVYTSFKITRYLIDLRCTRYHRYSRCTRYSLFVWLSRCRILRGTPPIDYYTSFSRNTRYRGRVFLPVTRYMSNYVDHPLSPLILKTHSLINFKIYLVSRAHPRYLLLFVYLSIDDSFKFKERKRKRKRKRK